MQRISTKAHRMGAAPHAQSTSGPVVAVCVLRTLTRCSAARRTAGGSARVSPWTGDAPAAAGPWTACA
eukprot:5983668-Prymnesium_polylepis.1